MEVLLENISHCVVCEGNLPLGPRPVVQASIQSKIAVIGQAPGLKVHQTGIPWDDKSGDNLRNWMGVSKEIFYDSQLFALVPMGFCYPGKGKSGDLPPRPECAPQWHAALWCDMPNIELTLLIGTYAQAYYLKDKAQDTLTETVRIAEAYTPRFFPLPHPSPRNNIWQAKNKWFETDILPLLKSLIQAKL